jgi:hypothetical protein
LGYLSVYGNREGKEGRRWKGRSKTANVKGRMGCRTSRKGTEDNLTIRKRSRRKIYVLLGSQRVGPEKA